MFSPFQALVEREQARVVFDDEVHSVHEALGFLHESLHDFAALAYEARTNPDSAAMLTALVRIAATAQRAAEDLNLCPREE